MKRSIALFSFSVFLSLACFSTSILAQGNTITGRVLDQNSAAVTQVYVELQNEVNSVVARTRTDDNGQYQFTRLSYGRFNLKIIPTGQNFPETTVEIVLSSPFAGSRSSIDQVYQDVIVKRRVNNNLGAGAAIFVQEIPDAAKTLYTAGKKELAKGSKEKAAELFVTAISIFPKYYAALEDLAKLRITESKFDQAIELFKRALDVNPRGATSWYGLAFANHALKNSEEAINAANQAISFAPETPEFILIKGLALRRAGKFEDAEKSFVKADALSEAKNPEISWNLALLYANDLKQYAKAAEQLEHYLKTAGKIPNEAEIRKLILRFREMAKK